MSNAICRRKPVSQLPRHRRLRAEALEDRTMLSAVGVLPFSVVMVGRPSNAGLPPATVIQFNPQNIGSAALSSTAIQWQGHFTEKLQSTPAAATTTVGLSAWQVDVVYSLNGKLLPPSNTTSGTGALRYAFDIRGTARETLTPLNAAGVPVVSTHWVCNDTIFSHIVVSPSSQTNAVANGFSFTTDTTIRQILAPIAAVAIAPTAVPSWIANTVTHATGSVVAPTSASLGSISLQEQIKQTLSPISATSSFAAAVWTVSAEFDATGTFLPPAPTATANAVASGRLSLVGELTGTISPPPGSTLPTQLFDNQITANVVFTPTFNPMPIVVSPTPFSGVSTSLFPAPLDVS
jgi:hypothetical protein